MKLTIQIPDEQFEKLEACAAAQHKNPNAFLAEALAFAMRYNPKENQMLLSGKNMSDIGLAIGGKTIRDADQLVKIFQDNFKIGVGGYETNICSEDAHTLKAQYDGMGFGTSISYPEYIQLVIKDALSLYLYGSTTGTFAYK